MNVHAIMDYIIHLTLVSVIFWRSGMLIHFHEYHYYCYEFRLRKNNAILIFNLTYLGRGWERDASVD